MKGRFRDDGGITHPDPAHRNDYIDRNKIYQILSIDITIIFSKYFLKNQNKGN